MTKWGLTSEELLLVYLTFLAQTENGDNGNTSHSSSYFKRWYDAGGQKRLKELFQSLKEKGIIVKNYNPESYIPDEIQFNKTFIKQYFKLTGELGRELKNAYPSTLYIGGKVVSLKNVTKQFKSDEEFFFWYASRIGHSVDKHNEILQILDWAKSNNLVNVGLIEFVGSSKWIEYQELKNQGISGQSTTFDIYETA